MPVHPEAPIEISAYNWVPDFARGHVRDLRLRWALEEIGADYRVRLLDPRKEKTAEYLLAQPFGQVPAYWEGSFSLFESGAILLHLGEKDERLLPRDADARKRAVSWMIAALNSVEPSVGELGTIDMFDPDAEWGKQRRPAVVENVQQRLSQLSEWLGDKEWLEERFTIADLIMVTVLRTLQHTDILASFGNLAAYVARGEKRPAFQTALKAQLADFVNEPA